jgi:hypothetical protein
MMGNFKKDTDIITNNEGIINMFGLAADAPGREWYLDAPLSQFVCTIKSPCNHFGCHPRAIPSTEPGREAMGDIEAKKLTAYPQTLSTAVALAVDSWWRRTVALGCLV